MLLFFLLLLQIPWNTEWVYLFRILAVLFRKRPKSNLDLWVYFMFHMQLSFFPSTHLLVHSVTDTPRWTHQGQSGGTKPPC